MLATTLQGFTIGLAMIIPIGAQNAFVLSRGIHRNHHLLTATLCSFCDLSLIAIGVFGGANVLATNPLGMALLTWGGVLFLGWFGGRSLLSAWRGKGEGLAESAQQMGAKSVLAMTLGVTLLNPHVYLDTLMLLGSLGSQVSESLRPAFAAGPCWPRWCGSTRWRWVLRHWRPGWPAAGCSRGSICWLASSC